MFLSHFEARKRKDKLKSRIDTKKPEKVNKVPLLSDPLNCSGRGRPIRFNP